MPTQQFPVLFLCGTHALLGFFRNYSISLPRLFMLISCTLLTFARDEKNRSDDSGLLAQREHGPLPGLALHARFAGACFALA